MQKNKKKEKLEKVSVEDEEEEKPKYSFEIADVDEDDEDEEIDGIKSLIILMSKGFCVFFPKFAKFLFRENFQMSSAKVYSH